jgi:hypothetical protein
MPPSLEKLHGSVECFEWWEHTVRREKERSLPYCGYTAPNVTKGFADGEEVCHLGELRTCWGRER